MSYSTHSLPTAVWKQRPRRSMANSSSARLEGQILDNPIDALRWLVSDSYTYRCVLTTIVGGRSEILSVNVHRFGNMNMLTHEEKRQIFQSLQCCAIQYATISQSETTLILSTGILMTGER